jgi:alkylated DNA repair dioxygenase AlkB
MVVPMPCRTPKWDKSQKCLIQGVYSLDEVGNTIASIHKVLDPSSLCKYMEAACGVQRFPGESGYGPKPRREVCYTVDGRPYRYSGVNHTTVKYPGHVLEVLPLFMKKVMELIPDNQYTWLSNGVDIIYSDEFPRGGSISAHSDKEGDWGMVIIYSLGQSRWIRFRRIDTGEFCCNVLMPHNSLTVMSGATFQRCYTHQVDKLGNDENIGVRLSLNVRFEKRDPQKK